MVTAKWGAQYVVVVLSRRPGPAVRTVELAGGLCVSNVDAHRILCSMGSEETVVN